MNYYKTEFGLHFDSSALFLKSCKILNLFFLNLHFVLIDNVTFSNFLSDFWQNTKVHLQLKKSGSEMFLKNGVLEDNFEAENGHYIQYILHVLFL